MYIDILNAIFKQENKILHGALNNNSYFLFSSFPDVLALTVRFSNVTFSFSDAKEWIFRLTSLFCSFMVWGFGISLATSRFWRLWEFNHKTIKVVFIGLWEAYYYQDFNISGTMKKTAVHSRMNSSWTISAEIEYARGLVTLANAFQPVVLIFSSLAILACWIQAPYPEFTIMCYNTSILFLILGNICILIAVTWNYTVDLYGESTLDFPATFPVSKEERVKKESIHVFKLGILTAILSCLSIIMLLYERWLVKPKGKVKPLEVAKNSPRRT